MENDIKGYYSGTSGLLLPVPNKLHYPEAFRERPRLSYYASLTNSIEINSSFYKIPLARTVEKWKTEVPEDFRFTFKLFKGITHNTGLAFDPAEISRFMEVVAQVEEKKGCILVQFPPSIRATHLQQLTKLMEELRNNDPDKTWKIALEFRHQSLYNEEIKELLEEYDLGMVVHDKGAAASPLEFSESDFRYLRFHGPGGNYRGSYPPDVLAEYASYISDWIIEGKPVFVYFNNTMGDAIENLNTLRLMVKDLN